MRREFSLPEIWRRLVGEKCFEMCHVKFYIFIGVYFEREGVFLK